MEIYYEGTRITPYVIINKCIVRDMCGERCDSLEMELDNAGVWYNWAPAEDDRIVVENGGYNSGIMYVNTVLPEDGKYRIMGTSLPCRARRKAYASFCGQSIENIMKACAAECGMGIQIFGIDKTIVIPYIERDNEGCGAFLNKLLCYEGAMLKCVNGMYTAIGIEYAQNRLPRQGMVIDASQRGVRYRREGTAIRELTIKTPYGEGIATDTRVSGSHQNIVIGKKIPIRDNAQAGRWAKNKLLCMNRNMESVTIQSEFSPSNTAMLRMDIFGNTDANGQWLIDTVEHDLKNLTTTTLLRRCIDTIQ